MVSTVVAPFFLGQDLTRRYHHPRPAVPSKRARAGGAFFFFRVPTLLSAGRLLFLFAARRAAPAYEHARTRSALRHARAHARSRALARTRTNDLRRTMRRAVRRRGWLDHSTRGEYGAHAHRRGGPLSSRPLSPHPYKAAAPKGPAFLFLNLLDELVSLVASR